MDLEQLTKHQIILLTLLVSFVTSIATGIVTVALMDQAPAGVTRVINQIVEHTVEKVVPTQAGVAAVTEKTVVVKDDDLAAQSIAQVQKSIVRLTAKGDDLLVARGVIVDGKGAILTDRGALVASGATNFEAILPSGERVPAVLRSEKGTTTSIATMDLALGSTTKVVPISFADSAKLQLGQSMIRIGGKGVDAVGSGVIAMLPSKESPDIEISVSSATPGSIVITLFGELVGMATLNSLDHGSDFYTTTPIPQAETKSPSHS